MEFDIGNVNRAEVKNKISALFIYIKVEKIIALYDLMYPS